MKIANELGYRPNLAPRKSKNRPVKMRAKTLPVPSALVIYQYITTTADNLNQKPLISPTCADKLKYAYIGVMKHNPAA